MRFAFFFSILTAILLLITGGRAALDLQRPAFGRYHGPGDNLWRINSAHALQAARNWNLNGIASSGLEVRLNFPSTVYPGNPKPYVSYPPIFVFWPIIYSWISGRVLNIKAVMDVGNIALFLTALFLAIFVTFSAISAGAIPWLAPLLGGTAGFLFVQIPSAALFFPYGWWADTAGLAPYVALLALEATPEKWKVHPWFRPIRVGIVAWGVLSDWLFFLLIGAFILVDFLSRPRKYTWENFVLPAVYVLVHLAVVLRSGTVEVLANKVAERTGIGNEISMVTGFKMWMSGLGTWLGPLGEDVYFVSLALVPLFILGFVMRRRFSAGPGKLFLLLFLLMMPMQFHSLLLHQHYFHHTYNASKFALLVTALISLIPCFAFARVRSTLGQIAIVAGIFWFSASYAAKVAPIARSLTENAINLDPKLQEVCEIIYSNSLPNDIEFSPDYANSDPHHKEGSAENLATPFAMNACGKYVFFAAEPFHVFKYFSMKLMFGKNREVPFRLRLWTSGSPNAKWKPFLVPGSTLKFGGLECNEISRSVIDPDRY